MRRWIMIAVVAACWLFTAGACGLAGSLLLAAPRPFIIWGLLEETIGLDFGSHYKLGNALHLSTVDPTMKVHLDSLAGHSVEIHMRLKK